MGKPYEPNAVIKNDIEFVLMQRKPGGYRSPTRRERILSIVSEDNYQRWFRQWSPEDEAAVTAALAATGTTELAGRPVDELSGGQRQRAWIAMALAQDTEIMLLDEPTTFLDIAHQIEVLDLLVELNRSKGRTIALVLHDLNHAARYAHHLVAMADGRIVAEGPPAEIVTPGLVKSVFNLECRIIPDPVVGTPLVIPIGAATPSSAPTSAVQEPKVSR